MVATDPYWLADAGGLDAVAALLREMGGADGRLVHLERLPSRRAVHGELQRPLPAKVAERLGVDRLWSHQAAAIDLLRGGRSVVIATGTGSGKSLCYQAPVAEAVVSPVRAGTSLLLFPTKALAQDQLRALQAMKLPRLAAATYDGDAGQAERAWVRRSGNVVLTNPEMLHHGILPHHDRWAKFLARLRYVVVDELHVLRGIFGSHVAQLLRRLRRLCAHYGASPTFAFTSATLGDADRLASSICGHDVLAVTNDGSPRGERLFALWNPPIIDDRGTRASANSEAAAVAAALVRADRRTIVFCRSRKGTELVAADLQRRLPAQLAPLVRPYRSGYLAEERRDIELALFTGHLRGVVATSALELGIDVSGLDACVLNGFPGTMASMWQQAGRAGRASAEGVTVLVAGDDQLDQWLMRHPHEVFRRSPEPAVINPANPYVLDPHLECAAFERPLSALDERYWPEHLDEGVVRLATRDRLAVRRRDRGHPVAAWVGSGWPSHGIGLRSASSAEVKIVRADDEAQLVGTVDVSRAPATVHPGAVYLHQGATYRVAELDLDARTAWVEPADGDEYTSPRSDVSFRILGREAPHGGPGHVVPRAHRGGDPGDRVPAHRSAHPHDVGDRAARAAAERAADASGLVHDRRAAAGRGAAGARSGPRCAARAGAHRDRHPAAVHHLRPVGCGRGLHGAAPRHRPADGHHLRRLSRWGGHRRARLRRGGSPPGRDARGVGALRLHRRLPVVRGVAEMRQRQRAARQGRRPSAVAHAARPHRAALRRAPPATSRRSRAVEHALVVHRHRRLQLELGPQPAQQGHDDGAVVVHGGAHRAAAAVELDGEPLRVEPRGRECSSDGGAVIAVDGGNAGGLTGGVHGEDLVAAQQAELHQHQHEAEQQGQDERQLHGRLPPLRLQPPWPPYGPAWSATPHDTLAITWSKTRSASSPILPLRAAQAMSSSAMAAAASTTSAYSTVA
ncbi:MAG: DEAD/DEAH box helicase [Acidimicrobiales bacterium]